MFRTLDKMNAMLDQPPETLKEVSFLQMYGRDLKEAQRWCEMYKVSNMFSFNYPIFEYNLKNTCFYLELSALHQIDTRIPIAMLRVDIEG